MRTKNRIAFFIFHQNGELDLDLIQLRVLANLYS